MRVNVNPEDAKIMAGRLCAMKLLTDAWRWESDRVGEDIAGGSV
jgi:hypothetical protein